jgi:hypothetical protein
VRKLLVSAYPRSWRAEYGEELAEILAQRKLTPGVVGNVLWNAAVQQWRADEPGVRFAVRKFGFGCLGGLAGLVIALTGHSIGLPSGYSWVDAIDWPIYLILGASVYLRKKKGIRDGATVSLKVALASNLPFVLGLLLYGVASHHLQQTWDAARYLAQFEILQSIPAGLVGAAMARYYVRFQRG